MIEVDVWWSFAIGACCAASASAQLAKIPTARSLVNEYFSYAVLLLSCVFAPSGIYLLWRFPGWETMWVFGHHSDMHAILPTIFASTNTLFGVLGFVSAHRLIASGKPLLAHSLWVSAYALMTATLGFGWRRFLYSGTSEQWDAGVVLDPLQFFSFSCPVFYTLLGLGVFLLPPVYYPMLVWPRQGGVKLGTVVSRIVTTQLAWAAVFTVAFFGFNAVITDKRRAQFEDEHFSMYANLAGFLVAQLIMTLLLIWPWLLPQSAFSSASSSSSSSSSSSRSKKRTKVL